MSIKEEELRTDVWTSADRAKPGPVVRVTHVPTGVTAKCDEFKDERRSRAAAIAEIEKELGAA